MFCLSLPPFYSLELVLYLYTTLDSGYSSIQSIIHILSEYLFYEGWPSNGQIRGRLLKTSGNELKFSSEFERIRDTIVTQLFGSTWDLKLYISTQSFYNKT